MQVVQNLIKAIDFACGSGHFLNEYAHQIEPLVDAHGGSLSDYYSQIIGVEKEDRLAKVAKVASYMHGQEQIRILDADALGSHAEIPLGTFDVLAANPPFSVDGFLQTLSDEDKKQFVLIQAIGQNWDTNTIQCFFIERMQHLIAPGGVVGVIVPSSILSNPNAIYIQTRELILKFFDVVSIAELGGGTFGRTTTNTVVLFLRRKAYKPEAAEHYANQVNDFFEGEYDDVYQDMYLIEAYCSHIEVPYEQYIKLFAQTSLEPLTELLQYDVFNAYKQDFDESTELKNRKKSNAFRRLTTIEQRAELELRFISYLHAIEKDKFLYFILAHQQENNVLIVNAPNTDKERKQFLGYGWSDAKRNEGIKYNVGETVNDIVTPLFDPSDLHNQTKINTAIRKNFNGEPIQLPNHCRSAKLVDMLDFSRTNFRKVIHLNPKEEIEIETKWSGAKLGEMCKLQGGNTFQEIYQGNTDSTQIPFFKVSDMNTPENYKFMTVANNYVDETVLTEQIRATLFERHSIVFPKVGMSIHTDKKRILGHPSGLDNNIMGVTVKDQNTLLPLFLLEVFQQFIRLSAISSNANPPSLSEDNLRHVEIPLPPLDVQQLIVDECDTVDRETENFHQVLTTKKQRIQDLVTSAERTSTLNQVVYRIPDIVNPQEKHGSVINIGLEHIQSQTGILVGDPRSDFSKIASNKNVFRDSDILYGKLRPILNKVYLANMNGICSTDILVLRPFEPTVGAFYKHFLLSEEFNSDVLKTVIGQQLPRTSWEEIERIPVPEPDVGSQLVAEIKQLESEITQAQAVIDKAAERKNAILAHYL